MERRLNTGLIIQAALPIKVIACPLFFDMTTREPSEAAPQKLLKSLNKKKIDFETAFLILESMYTFFVLGSK